MQDATPTSVANPAPPVVATPPVEPAPLAGAAPSAAGAPSVWNPANWQPSTWNWDLWVAVAGTPFICLVGVVLTALLLPGTWLMVLWAVILKLWQPDLVAWWTLVIVIVLASIGEGLEFVASALGAAKAGGSKHGALGAMVGSFLGAIVGIFVPPPVIGSIVCAALGAAGGAIAGERWLNKTSWEDSRKVATGAAIGRLLATIAKVLIAIMIATVLCIAVVN